jgi:hypothetical protein
VAVERRVAHPMVPLELFRSRTVSVTLTGVAFLPMMLIGLALTACYWPPPSRVSPRVFTAD